jgi:signal transduction histidine kinase
MTEPAPAVPTPWWHWDRIRDVNHDVFDPLLAAVLLALCLLNVVANPTDELHPTEPDALAFVLTVIGAGVLAFRTRWPMPVMLASLACTGAYSAIEYPENGLPIACMVALYTVASRTSRRVSLVAAVATALVIVALTVIGAQGLDVGGMISNFAIFGIAYASGLYVKVRRAYTEQLELRAADAEEHRRREADQAVAAERLRIARELHDVVAHAMSVVAVQSGVAAHVIDQRPDEARSMLQNINATSREALNEMRRMLGVLRADDDAGAEMAPAPTLGDLRSLVASVEGTGADVELDVTGEPTALAPALDLTAFRIVQEALTNVVKHAGPARVTVRVDYQPDQLEIEVADDGRGAASALHDAGAGHGLVGMRERVDLYGGSLSAGPQAGGGFRVRATLPYGADLVAS